MFSIYCIFAFGVVFPLLAKDFPEAEYLAGGIQGKGLRHLRPRDLISGGNITSLGHSKHSKRSAEVTGLTCTSLSGIESTIKNNTHTVLLVLTTFQVPMFMMQFGQSSLYRSEDYGKTFKDVTHLIDHTFVQAEFGIGISPDHSGKVILTGDRSEVGGTRVFRSRDYGLSFTASDLPFLPLIQMLYNPADCNILLTLSMTLDLWLSEDFGATWSKIHVSVCLVRWGTQNSIYLTTNRDGSCNDKGMLELKRSRDNGRSFQTIATRVFSFVLGGRFVFASIMTGLGTERMIHVSMDGGDVWNMAQLPVVNHEQFYSILTANQDMVFMHVDDPGENTVETVITFDQGAKWQALRSPQNGHCDMQTAANKPERCRLHIHASYSTTLKMNVPMLPLSQPNAVGLILAHGSMGDSVSVLSPDVYVSDDGGYSWLLALRGPHHYAILDSGGLLVALEHSNLPIRQIKFSTDEGQCWHVYNFTSDPLHFSGMDSEPGSRSMNVSLWGYRTDFSKWEVITIDFGKLLHRDCGDEDYVKWLAHSADLSDPGNGCMLGYKEQYQRLKKDSVCWNGRGYTVAKQPTPCPCTMDDYHCDFGYYRSEPSGECVEQEEMKGHPLQYCLNGTTEQLLTSGYRRIPGDQCEGGFQPHREETDLSKRCTSSNLEPESLLKVSVSNTAVIVMVVLVLLLTSAATGVWLVKKYVCGGRFLVHRYSVMREHAEANGLEEAEHLDAHTMESGKTHYHDDSDQDLLE
uniref:VPS10 domain-containing protein n=1 Tax=Gadus morhua TaxID=8049 RepID=A0A8C5CVY3_GADMO